MTDKPMKLIYMIAQRMLKQFFIEEFNDNFLSTYSIVISDTKGKFLDYIIIDRNDVWNTESFIAKRREIKLIHNLMSQKSAR